MRFQLLFPLVLVSLAPTATLAQATCPSPAPPAGLDPATITDRSRFLEYARGLEFHAASHPTGETRRLVDISTPGNPDQRRYRLGPNAAARPQVCSHRNTNDDLRAGRVVGMQTMDAAYPKLRLPRGESFLWIDRLDGNTARGVIVPNDATTPSTVVSVRVEFTPDLPDRGFSEGRWMFNPDDDDLWYVCAIKGCCVIVEDPGGP